jgi:hypothetical protein
MLLLTLWISRWILNSYVSEKFSVKEMFVLEVLLMTAASIVGYVWGMFSTVIEANLGITAMNLLAVVAVLFDLYMILTYLAAMRSIAGISMKQALVVIFSPMVLYLLGVIVFLIATGGQSAT